MVVKTTAYWSYYYYVLVYLRMWKMLCNHKQLGKTTKTSQGDNQFNNF